MADVDINKLREQLTAEPFEVGGDEYLEQSEFVRPLEEGTYTFRQGPLTDDNPFSATKKGALQVSFAYHEVVGGDKDGAKITFDRVNGALYDRAGVKACSLYDHLRAVGIREKVNPNDIDAVEPIIRGKEGATFKGIVRWEWFCRDCTDERSPNGKTVAKGMKRGGLLADGKTHDHVLECPGCGGKLGAQARIDRRMPLAAPAEASASA